MDALGHATAYDSAAEGGAQPCERPEQELLAAAPEPGRESALGRSRNSGRRQTRRVRQQIRRPRQRTGVRWLAGAAHESRWVLLVRRSA